MNRLKHKLAHGLWNKGTWKPIGHVYNEFSVANIYAAKTQTRSGFVRNSLVVLIEWLVDCHLGQIYVNVLDCSNNLSKIMLPRLIERAVDV